MKSKTLQEKYIEAMQLEEAARLDAKEAINRLRDIHKKRIELEKLLNSNPN